jgi:DNA polymerase I-like protein with 3'-5' exonuclease and polymerase domains
MVDTELGQSPAAPLNAAYLPRSQGRTPGTLIPANMATAAQTALDKLERSVGDVDEFVRQRLGYASKEELWQHLYAEQIDANALAFWQRDNQKVFLNGDQTGNGKGRFCASQIVDAINQGYVPVFVTQKSTLYVSMLADLQDIGKPGVSIFATDSNLKLDLPDRSKLRTGSVSEQEAEMQRLVQQGLGNYNAIFTTYSQLQTVDNGKEPFRRDFLRELAPRAIFIFDEAHEAGGSTGEKGWVSSNAAPNRAEFVRELVDRAAGAVFASATAIKDPAVMDLYARRSDASEAVSSIVSLQRTLQEGGVPLQQMIAAKFVASGQMLRRERSFEGVSFQAKVVGVDRQVADDISSIMRAISQFDLAKQKSVEKLSKQLKKEAKAASEDNSIGQAGAKSMNFTSLMFNAIDQGLLCQKAEATVQEASAAIERGQKPVIAVASTMDSLIEQYAEDKGLSPGDPITISFGDVLSRYLERSRDVTIKNHEGIGIRRRMTDDELGDAVAAYDTAREIIDSTDLSAIPLSSIDYIKWRLGQAGLRVGEITGRQHAIDYSPNGDQGYARRSTKEITAQAKVDTVDRFNAGSLDVLILNRSGSTGINLHASEKFADQQQRHLIMAQAERDINQVMQMLGRVNRFGQVSEPEITYLMSDIPAEKRLGAILSKKMATLNANTTADRDSALSVSNVVDFLNPYGEEVIAEILEDNPQLEAKLAFPSEGLKGESDIELIGRVTGRIPLLSIQDQEELYGLIESETLDLIAQKQAMGESVLEAQQLDLDARTIGRMEVIPDNSPIRNEFTGPVYLDVVDAKVPVKPFSQLEAINLVRENLTLEPVKQVKDHDFAQAEGLAKVQARKAINELRQDTQQYRAATLAFNPDSYSKDKARERINKQFAHVSQTLRDYPPGQSVRVVSPEGNITYGVMAQVWQKSRSGSPAAPSNWRAQILTDNQARMLTIPLTRFNRGKEGMLTTISKQETNWEGQNIYAAFDLKQQDDRTERQIFQGNLLKAYEKYPTGQFLNYTDYQGKVQQGLVMPASFDIQESLREQPVAFQEPRQVKAFLTELTNYQGAVKTLDEALTIKSQAAARFGRNEAAGFVLQVPKTGIGDRFSLNQDIIAAAGSEFYSVSDRMELLVPNDRLDAVLQILMKEQSLSLAAFDFKGKAREYLGVKLPELQQLEVEPVASPSPNPVRRESAIPLVPTEPAEDNSKQPQPVPEPDRNPTGIALAKEQQGGAEKNVARFLREAGLSEAVLQGEDFHLQVENKPYIPLVVERHGSDLFVTHYLEQNGDLFMDSEMVFRIRDGNLQLQETGVQNPFRGGEIRACDRGFAQLFSRNLLDQGFAQAARESWMNGQAQPHEEAQGVMESLQASAEELKSIREGFQAIVSLEQSPASALAEVSVPAPIRFELQSVEIENSPLGQIELDIFQNPQPQNQETVKAEQLDEAEPEPSTPESPVELLPVLDTQLVTTIDHLQETVDLYQNVSVLAIATRTTGLDPHADSIRLIQLAAIDHPVSIIDCAALSPTDLQPLNRLLQGETEKVFQNASLDLQMLKATGLEVKGNLFDTMIGSQLLEAGLDRSHTLEAITQRYLNTNLDKAEQTNWKNGLTQTQIGDAARDVALLLPLRDKLASRLAEKELTAIAAIEFQAVHGVAEMEWHGMGIHQEKLQSFADELRQQKANLGQQLGAMLPHQNIDLESPKQLLAALKQTGIPISNTRKEALIPLQDRYPVLSKLMEYRSVSKALSTYAEGYKSLIHPKTGRLHPHLNQCGAVTGRFSCDKPNLQNVPRDPRIKGCFEPAPGNVLVKADYSQIELRIAAKISGEPRMIQAYQNGQDLHSLTASLLLHKPTTDITGDERRLAKAVNFGLIYGMQAHGFQTYARTNYGVSLSLLKAEQHREQFFNTYSGLTEWHDRVKQAQSDSCRTLGGRLRHWEGEAPFTEIINAPVQGTSADITKLAIANFQAARDALPGLGAKLLMQVHDEIVIEVPEAQAERAGWLLVQAMREAGQHFLKEIPVEIEASICEDWSGKNARPVPLEPQVEPAVIQPQPVKSAPQKQIDTDLMKLAHSVRNLDLPTIAQHLGLERDRADKSKWIGWAEVNGEREKQHVISITGSKFMDWKTEQGGTGAVSLTMAVREWDFKSTVEWLAQQKVQRSIPEQAIQASREPRSLELPIPNPANWESVRKYLTETRAIPTTWVDKLRQQGLVYADDRRNAVFLRQTFDNSKTWERAGTTGATLRGTVGDFKGLAPGSSKDNGWFWVGVGRGEVERVVVTESPIDALSLSVLAKGQPHQGRTIYLSTDGKGAIPTEALKYVVDRGGKVAAAFDADADGRKLTEKVIAAVANADRLTPTQGKDWNEQLLAVRQDLRDWYRQARDIGRSETHLSRIEQVGKAFTQDGTPPGERDLRMKAQDQEAWQQQVQTVANCAQTILDRAGEPQAGGTLFEGKKYVLFARDDLLYALAEQRGIPLDEDDRTLLPNPIQQPDQGVILKMIAGEVSTDATRVTKVDAQRFEQFAELLSNRLREQQYDR